MKKISIYALSISLSILLFACNNTADKNSENTDSTKISENNTTENVENVEKNNENAFFRIKAKFDMVVPNSRGAWFLFTDENGESYEFYAIDSPQKLREITRGLMPNEPSPKFENIWFEVEYNMQTIAFYDGGTGDETMAEEVKVITSIAEVGGGNTSTASKLTFEQIQNAKFFGIMESYWLLEFKSDHVEYTNGLDGETSKAYYTENPKFKQVSDNQLEIRFTFDLDKGYISSATITKEACSDGMSDKTHDYSITVQWEDRKDNGCGRNVEK